MGSIGVSEISLRVCRVLCLSVSISIWDHRLGSCPQQYDTFYHDPNGIITARKTSHAAEAEWL
jgi:hypothetical protein